MPTEIELSRIMYMMELDFLAYSSLSESRAFLRLYRGKLSRKIFLNTTDEVF